MDSIWQDLRYGIRMLAKRPGFTAVAILTLALGIGANTVIFSAVNSIMIRPLPYPDPEQLVMVWDTQPQVERAPHSFQEYVDWKEQKQVFDELAAYFTTSSTLTGEGDPEELRATRSSASLLPMLGIKPALGRTFRPEEDDPASEPVVMISHSLWQRRYGSDAGVLGKVMTLGDRSFTIIGVLPSDVRGALPQDSQDGNSLDIWVPLRLDSNRAPRGLHWMRVIGRLRPGLGINEAQSELEPLAERIKQDRSTNHGIKIDPLHEHVVGDTRTFLLLMLGAVGLVLLIACTNIANLMLSRASARQKEIAIRIAVGASRARLIRQLLTESVLLAVLSGAFGLLLAVWGMKALIAASPVRLPRTDEISIDGRVLLFTMAVSLVTGLLFGLVPALQSSTSELNETLKEGWRASDTFRRNRMRSLLVIGEVAISLVLLIGAGLLIRSFINVMNVNKGFNPERVLALDLYVPFSRYPEPRKQAQFFQQVIDRAASIAGVESAGVVNHIPLGGSSTNGGFRIEGVEWPNNESPMTEKRLVSAGYFSALKIPLIQGRYFTEQDREGSRPVAIINETMAERFFPGENPIGKRINMSWDTPDWQEIVGVIADIKHEGLHTPAAPELYVPFTQRPIDSMTLVVRATAAPENLVAALREQIRAIDKDRPVARVRNMEQVVSESVAGRRFSTSLFGGFAGVALFLAAVGIYGVLSYSVAQRTREIGIRMALGAKPGDIFKLVVGQGILLTLIGVGAGIAAALILTRLLASLLYGVSASDPLTMIAISLLLIAVALIASYIPARRATKVDPMIALRYE